jgi:uncharacterized protein
MPQYTITREVRFPQGVLITDKTACAGRLFGLNRDQLQKRVTNYFAEIDIYPGDIIFITGASGAGKSIVLKELQKVIPAKKAINIDELAIPADKTVIDCIDASTLDSLSMLASAGLAETFCILNNVENLSEGEKYRFKLALAISKKKQFIFADEFCSNLDRITASVISWRIRKLASKSKTAFILASSQEDILADLQPDCIVNIDLTGKIEINYKETGNKYQIRNSKYETNLESE